MLKLEKLVNVKESDYQLFYECAPVGYFDLGESCRIIKLNLTGAQLLGYPRTYLMGKRFLEFVPKNAKPIFSEHLQQTYITKMKQSCKLELMKNDGSSFYSQLESIAITDYSHNIIEIRLSVIDINEYQLTAQALRGSEEKFRSLVETTKEWIWTIDLKGRFLYSNSSVLTILGYSPTELLNRSRFTFIHKDDRAMVTRIFPLLIKEKQGWSDLCLRWQCKDGSYRYLESNAVPFFNHAGELVGFRGADRDITIRKQAELQKYQHQTALHQASKINSVGEFACALAHELAQPLTAINNFMEVSIHQLNASTSLKENVILEALQKTVRQTERIGQIIHRMRNFVRHGKLYFEKLDINELIRESIELIRYEFPTTQIKINFNPGNPQIFIVADKIQLTQVMLNLIRNSIEAMIEGNTLNPELQIKSENFSTRHVFVSVCDNGPGFCKSEDLTKLFDAFFSTKSNSLGMGLTICRMIIEAHHGRLTASQNASNKGMSFQFILPENQENDDSL